MSTEPTPTPKPESTPETKSTSETEPTTETATTEITARGREDPWAAVDEAPDAAASAHASPRTHNRARPSAAAQRQFDPRSLSRLRNLMDDQNAYCS